MHQLNRYPSSPALSTNISAGSGNNNNNNNTGQSNYYNALTPKTSYDSLGSLRSFGSATSGGGSSTWSYGGGFSNNNNNPPSTPNTEFSRNVNFFESGLYSSRPNTNEPSGYEQQRRRSETESLLLPQHHGLMSSMPPPPAPRHSASGSVSSPTATSSPNTIHQVDPAIEQAFRNMAKSLEEKEGQISDLKLQIEALLTSAATGGVSKNDKTILENATNRKMDGNEMTHRIVMRLKTLKQENETLGKMLSQGRAAQKEVEVGVLKRENAMLKSRIEELEQEKSSVGN